MCGAKGWSLVTSWTLPTCSSRQTGTSSLQRYPLPTLVQSSGCSQRGQQMMHEGWRRKSLLIVAGAYRCALGGRRSFGLSMCRRVLHGWPQVDVGEGPVCACFVSEGMDHCHDASVRPSSFATIGNATVNASDPELVPAMHKCEFIISMAASVGNGGFLSFT